ncbi:hypothetical protein OIU84_009030 [Salix udensis]|uniref:Uncharacterized protein n=1 Tax=Salix udensis TaxID=889485 RepID=A0AAD6JQR9_9ROSI|nr:hypothetical protein OIU84_009030 [Salix udensis]
MAKANWELAGCALKNGVEIQMGFLLLEEKWAGSVLIFMSGSHELSFQMTSISQSVLMALTVTVNKFASSNVHAVNKKEGKTPTKAATRAAAINGSRGILLSTVVDVFSANDSSTKLLKKYLKKSEENKAKNHREVEV